VRCPGRARLRRRRCRSRTRRTACRAGAGERRRSCGCPAARRPPGWRGDRCAHPRRRPGRRRRRSPASAGRHRPRCGAPLPRPHREARRGRRGRGRPPAPPRRRRIARHDRNRLRPAPRRGRSPAPPRSSRRAAAPARTRAADRRRETGCCSPRCQASNWLSRRFDGDTIHGGQTTSTSGDRLARIDRAPAPRYTPPNSLRAVLRGRQEVPVNVPPDFSAQSASPVPPGRSRACAARPPLAVRHPAEAPSCRW